ncbi:DUF3102 domain-containing protein [Desulfosporosinus nitroreducens]|uniref:DUF3102 domain-containing protein n=1 Tax=Desulfosporosinus nitroreducens TaxID=2018668 RepID=A0ABT8QRJ4_9FIRM|nr:DUF3102 domain-containing protein [Desulfosporosinus nitroreducens]MCO1603795.1 DUF3102 domain-containing protein [Desulfosporosinus nitroreducens]MDO0823114.1 DUF3102 domain-containing protein [Desulfosporosinus nitroreducens]
MNFTQALILLGVPEEVRSEFIAELDIDNIRRMSRHKIPTSNRQNKQRLSQIQPKNDRRKVIKRTFISGYS